MASLSRSLLSTAAILAVLAVFPLQPLSAAAPADPPAERTTSAGTRFVAPAGWRVDAQDAVVVLSPPEGGARVVLVETQEADPDAAVATAWMRSGIDSRWPLKVAFDQANPEGWDQHRSYQYETSANERRVVGVDAYRKDARWTVLIVDFPEPLFEKRVAEFIQVVDRLMPAGYTRESFAGRKAHALDADRIARLSDFVRQAQQQLGIPGVSIGLVQGGKVVFAGGFGVREHGRPSRVDGRTRYMIASNTKAMTTLMLARLVDRGLMRWDTPVVDLMPGFALGDATTTRSVQIQHLVCACTGLPRQDYEWILEFADATPASTLRTLATMQPTSEFGALFQYSNALASAGGYVGAYARTPRLELGQAYDRAMQEEVFGPLGMSSTIFDFRQALRGNHAAPHAHDVDGNVAPGLMAFNYAVVPIRPAGGAWSNVDDVLQYVRLELARGRLPDGRPYLPEAVLLERHKAKVRIGNDSEYGMGLETDRTWGIPVVHHGGSMLGYKSDMIWLPEHDVGAVILTNSDAGGVLLTSFRRRLLEILFDGRERAASDVEAAARNIETGRKAERPRLVVPAGPAEVAALAPRYRNDALGTLTVRRNGTRTSFDFGEWASEVATRHNDDGTISFVLIAPGVTGLPLVVAPPGEDGKRRLIVRSAQQEYVFEET